MPLAQRCFKRDTVVADKPAASGPTSTFSASLMSPVEMPFRYSHGSAASRERVLRTYGGTSSEWKTTASPVRERTFGTLTKTAPTPV